MAGALDAAVDDPATPDDVNQSSLLDTPESETTPVQLTTTEEAKRWARRGLSDYYDHVRTGEDAIAAEATSNANRAKQALRQAQQRLMQDPYAPSASELNQRQGAALMTPGNNNINGLRSYYLELANQQQAERERQAGLAGQSVGYDTQAQTINEKLSGLKQKLIEGQEKNAAGIAKQSLQTLGRGIGKDAAGAAAGLKPTSPEGKLVWDSLGPDAYFVDPDTGKASYTPLYLKKVSDMADAKIASEKARAGIDATDMDPATKATVADDAGVPANILSPYDTMSTKEKLQAKRIEQQHAQTDFAKLPDLDRNTSNMISQIDEFLNLNKHTHTGPELSGLDLPGVSAGPHGASVHGGEGFNINPVMFFRKYDPNIQNMDKVTQNLVTTMTKPGFSRVTNFDLQTFQKGMMGIDKPYSVNQQIAAPLKAFGKDQLDYHQFLQDYYQVHQTRQGAEGQWRDYLNHNPIFDPTKPVGSMAPNTNRMPYQDYFRAKNKGISFKSVELPQSWSVEAAEHAKEHPEDLKPQTERERAAAVTSGNNPRFGGIARPAPNTAALLPPGQVPGTDAGAPPPRAPAWQPADDQPAVEGHAEGGSVDDEDPSELTNALAALRTGATMHASQGQEDRHSPATNYFGEAAGGASTVAALLALARLRGRLGRGAAAVGRYAAENPTKAATIAGAGAGAASGALGASPGDSGEYGLAYGTTGAALGPLAALGGRGAARSLYSLGERMRGLSPISAGDRRTVGAVERDLGKAGSGANWQDLIDQMRSDRKLGVPSTLGDQPEMNSTRGLAKAALTKDTPEARAYSDQLNTRQAQAGDRTGDIVNNSLAPDPYMQQTEHLKSELYKNASPLYDTAYKAFPAVQSKALFDIMNTPAGAEAAKRAFVKMQNKQRPIGGVNPQTGLVDKPSLEYLDNVKRSLDDMILREEGTGANYQPTDDGQILRGMREKLRNELDTATALPNGQPGPYQQARQQYAGDLEVLDALRSGREDFKGLSPEALQQKVQGMSFAERDAYRSGVAEYLFRQLGSRGENPNVNPAAKILSNPDIAEKVGAIFEKPREATNFLASLQREADMFDTSKPMITTAKAGQEKSMSPGSITSMARAKLMTENTANDINENMRTSAMDPQAMNKMQRLRDAADRLRSRDTIANQAGVAVGAGAAGAAMPSNINVPPDQEQQ